MMSTGKTSGSLLGIEHNPAKEKEHTIRPPRPQTMSSKQRSTLASLTVELEEYCCTWPGCEYKATGTLDYRAHQLQRHMSSHTKPQQNL